MTDLSMASIVLGKGTQENKNDGSYFFSVICPFELVCSEAVPIELCCGLVTVNLDVQVDLSVACLLHLEII